MPPDISYILFLKTLVAVAPLTVIPIVFDTPVLERVLIVLPLMLTVGEVFEHEIPVTLPPVPVDVKLLIVFEETLSGVPPLKLLPILIAVIVLWPVIFVIVLLDILVVVAPTYATVIPVSVLVPPVQLLRVFPVIVFAGLVPEPSELLNPVIQVAPVTVMFEKLFPV